MPASAGVHGPGEMTILSGRHAATCSDCRRALSAVELVLKYLVRPRLPKRPGLISAATAITEQVRELGFNAEAENIATEVLRGKS